MGGKNCEVKQRVRVRKQETGHRKKAHLSWKHPCVRPTIYVYARMPKCHKFVKKAKMKGSIQPFRRIPSYSPRGVPLAFSAFIASPPSRAKTPAQGEKKMHLTRHKPFAAGIFQLPEKKKQSKKQENPGPRAAKPAKILSYRILSSPKAKTLAGSIPAIKRQTVHKARACKKTALPYFSYKTQVLIKTKIRFPSLRGFSLAKTHSPKNTKPVIPKFVVSQKKPKQAGTTPLKIKVLFAIPKPVKTKCPEPGKPQPLSLKTVKPEKPTVRITKYPKNSKTKNTERPVKNPEPEKTHIGEFPIPRQVFPRTDYFSSNWMIARFSRKRRSALKVAHDATPPEF